MSHTVYPAKTPALQRSQLAVPGNRYDFFEKAANSAADAIFLDLEDSVASNDKEKARQNVVEALNHIDWGNKLLLVRINGLDSPYMYQDVIDIVSQCPRLDRLLIPKVGVAADVYALDMLVSQIEMAHPRATPVSFECLIETALGMSNVDAIAKASPRMAAMSFGLADYAASLGMQNSVIGGNHPDYGVLTPLDDDKPREFIAGDMWHHAQMTVLNACRAHGLVAIDGPYGDFSDPEGYRATAKRLAAIGFEGKWAIHPSQITLANEVFTPSDEDISRARAIIDAMQQAEHDGLGAVSLDGKLIDLASIKMAENILAKASGV